MKNLKQILEYVNTTDNSLLQHALSDFIRSLTIELLNEQVIDPISDDDFFNRDNDIINLHQDIELDANSSLSIIYKSSCDFEYAEYDEVGLYSKGDRIGCKNISCEIIKIELYLFDGSILDLTDRLYEYVYNKLM